MEPVYQNWKNSTSNNTLLCSGIVGSGKTILCASIIEDLTIKAPPSTSLAYFFCSYDEVVSLDAREVIGSLARQLFRMLAVDAPKLQNKDISSTVATFDAQRIVEFMLSSLPHNKQYIIILDGLDECDQIEVETLTELVRPLRDSPSHTFKFFWTCRKNLSYNIPERLRPDLQLHMSHATNNFDMSNYIELALSAALQDGRLKLRDPSIIECIQDSLETNAQEMFLWAAPQIDSICAQNSDYDILECLKNLPKGLPATFRRILDRLDVSEFANAEFARKIFQIIASAQRPLTLDELGEAISVTPGDTAWNSSKMVNDMSKALQCCGSFLVVDEEHTTVHFAHCSVKDYFVAHHPTDPATTRYYTDLWKAEFTMGSICVTYLNCDVFSGQLTAPDGPQQLHTAHIPTAVVQSALPHEASMMALALLKYRRKPRVDLDHKLQSAVITQSHSNPHAKPIYQFIAYCRDYWLKHTERFYYNIDSKVYKLWRRMVDGTTKIVELPWHSHPTTPRQPGFLHWLAESRHNALIEEAIRCIWYRDPTLPIGTMSFFSKPGNLDSIWPNCDSNGMLEVVSQMETLLNYVKDEDRQCARLGLKYHERLLAFLFGVTSQGRELTLQLLLDVGVDINALMGPRNNLRDDEVFNTLHCAVGNGHLKCAEILIDHGADVNVPGVRFGTVLQACAADPTKVSLSLIKQLIKKGADVNAHGEPFGTVLIAASYSGSLDVVQTLLHAGAEVNARSEIYGTALDVAFQKPHIAIIKALITADAKYSEFTLLEVIPSISDEDVKFIVEKIEERDGYARFFTSLLYFIKGLGTGIGGDEAKTSIITRRVLRAGVKGDMNQLLKVASACKRVETVKAIMPYLDTKAWTEIGDSRIGGKRRATIKQLRTKYSTSEEIAGIIYHAWIVSPMNDS